MKKIWHSLKKLFAQYHLKHICPQCSYHKRETRDILHDHHCYWNENWKKQNYEIPMFMGIWNYIRLYVLKKKIKLCIHGRNYKGAEV